MRLLFELSMEHPTLPRAEALATLEALGAAARPLGGEPGALVARVDGPGGADAFAQDLAERLALTHRVDRHWFTTTPSADAIVAGFQGRAEAIGGRSFAVRGRRLGNAHPEVALNPVERAAGTALREGGPVDLTDPDVEVRVVLGEAAAYGGAALAEVDRGGFEARHVKHRPFFSPVSLHPRLARALVNLARVRPGDRVVDPFAGTGGIALEAGLVGARVTATDLDARMVEGARDVLDHYGVRDATLYAADVAEALARAAAGAPVDAVVTDPPYGRSATTDREALASLYRRFLEAAAGALRPGGHVATVFPSEAHVELGAAWLSLESTHAQRVHRSLTRHFAVYRKPP